MLKKLSENTSNQNEDLNQSLNEANDKYRPLKLKLTNIRRREIHYNYQCNIEIDGYHVGNVVRVYGGHYWAHCDGHRIAMASRLQMLMKRVKEYFEERLDTNIEIVSYD